MQPHPSMIVIFIDHMNITYSCSSWEGELGQGSTLCSCYIQFYKILLHCRRGSFTGYKSYVVSKNVKDLLQKKIRISNSTTVTKELKTGQRCVFSTFSRMRQYVLVVIFMSKTGIYPTQVLGGGFGYCS